MTTSLKRASTSITGAERHAGAADNTLDPFDGALRASGIVLYDFDLVRHTAAFHGDTARVLGLPADALPPSPDAFLARVDAADRALASNSLPGAPSETFHAHYRLQRPDGTSIAVDDTATLERTVDGAPCRRRGVLRDVTEFQRTEAALRERSEQLQLALQVARANAFTWDVREDAVRRPAGITHAGATAAPRPDRFAGVLAKVHPDDREAFEARVRAAIAAPGGEYRNTYRVVGDTGSDARWIEDVGRVDFDERGARQLIGLATDITERRRADDLLRESEAFARQVSDVAPSVLYVYDLMERRNVWGNRGTFEGLGHSREQLDAMAGNLLSTLMHPEDFARYPSHAVRLASLADQEAAEFEYRMRAADGTYRWLCSRDMVFRRDASGAVTQIIGAALDITTRKAAELAERERSQRLALLARTSERLLMDRGRVSDVITSVLRELGDLLGVEGFYHYRFDEASATLQLVAADGVTDEERRQFVSMPLGALLCGHVAQSCTRLVIEDLQRERVAGSEALRRAGTTAYAGFPLLAGDTLLGTVAFTSRQRTHFPPGDLEVIQTVCDMLASCLDRGRLLTEVLASEGRFRATFEQAAVGVAHVALDGRWLRVNRALSDMLGYSETEMRALTFQDITHPEDLDADLAFVTQLLAGAIPAYSLQKRYFRRDGSVLWTNLTVALLRGTDGQPQHFISVVEDITARRRAEDRSRLLAEAAGELLASDDPQGMLQALFARIAPALDLDVFINYMTDDDGLRMAASIGVDADVRRTVERLAFGQAVCGRVAALGVAACLADVQHSDDAATLALRGMGIRAYVCHPLLSGDRCIGTLSFGSRTKDSYSAEETTFLQAICSYVTAAYERLRLLDGLRESDRRKDEFLATLAHELRNPLAPIRNGLQILRLGGGDPVLLERSRTMMERQVEHMTRLIEDLMDLSRVSRGSIMLRKARLDVAEVVHSAADTSRPLMDERQHHFSVTMPAGVIHVDADLTRLSQVLVNLLNNAAKFTDPGGRIRLTVSRVGDDVEFRVRDSGVGIPASQLPHVFDMFTQVDRTLERSQHGLGIGLNIVKRLVEMHGGTVHVESEGQGCGAEFIVRVPAVREAGSERLDAAVPVSASSAHSRRILIADDNVDGAASLSTTLRIMGHETLVVHDGADAVAAVGAFRPDVVLLDIGMPRLNGFDACRQIRALAGGDRLLVVACTGWGQDDDRRRSQLAGFDVHLTKPIDPVALEALLRGTTSTAR